MKTTYKYIKVRKEFFNGKNKYCQVRVPGICMNLATDVHHRMGGSDRCITLEDPSTFVACCRACHRYLHEHPKFAQEMKFEN